jgi:hypothetical protein
MGIMEFFPYEKYSLQSKLSPDEVWHILIENVKRDYYIDSLSDSFSFLIHLEERYKGTIKRDSFEITEIGSRNPPTIYGKIFPASDGSIIQIKAFNVFIIIFNGLFGIGFVLMGLLFMLLNQNLTGSLILISFGASFYLLTLGIFKHNSSKAKSFLEKLLQAKELH